MKNNTKGKFGDLMRGESSSKLKIGIALAISIIAIVVLVLVYANTSKKDMVISLNDNEESKTSEASEIAGDILEEASTQIGKTVNEVKEEKKPIIINNDKEDKNSNTVQEIKDVSDKKNANESTDKTISKTTDGTKNETKNKVVNNETAKSQSTQKQSEQSNSKNNVNVDNTEDKKQEEKSEEEKSKDEEPTFAMPANGQIIRDYAKENLVYSDTLKEWVTHMGIDIKAEKTSVVKASEKGKIKSIKNDPRYGLTIVIEHNNGYSTVYSNLLTTEFVKVGEQVEKGQTIATVGDTATFEMADESHIHFEILKNNVQIDPNMYIK